ncbi:MAG: Mth938-like domain-containing protein [Betaproteobacteria bacterium]|nr:Mth938-like domain-containing protein [Betaproteobacteria bacterium]
MKLIRHAPDTRYAITGHGPGFVLVNDERVETSLVVSGERILREWATDFASLAEIHFEQLLSFEPELVLLGTGAVFRFPHPPLTRPLVEAGIGLEVMDTQAACRTYAVLASEGRHVVAGLLIP